MLRDMRPHTLVLMVKARLKVNTEAKWKNWLQVKFTARLEGDCLRD